VTDRKAFHAPSAPPAIGPYSPALQCGEWVFTSGQLPITDTGELIVDDAAAATRQALANVKTLLEAAGSRLEDVVKVTVFVTDLSTFGAINKAYAPFFRDPPPARSCVEVRALPMGAPLEIEAVARRRPAHA